MGKKLIIKGANFSTNAIELEPEWVTIFEGDYTASTNGEHALEVTFDNEIPLGTRTKLSVIVTSIEGHESAKIAVAAVDTSDTTHNNYWHDGSIYTGSLDGQSYSKEKVLEFDLKGLDSYFQFAGSQLYVKLEILSS